MKLGSLLAAALLSAATVSIAHAGVTAVSLGRVNPADYASTPQPSAIATKTGALADPWSGPDLSIAQDRFGQTAPSPGQSNAGWNPWGQTGQGGYGGPSDTTHAWVDIGVTDGWGLYALSGTKLAIIWGSPNNDNTVTFYSDAAGTTAIGSIDETSLFNPAVDNTGAPGFLVDFSSTSAFKSVSFSANGGSAFEFAVVAPEASTWAMMAIGFAGLAFAGRRARRPVAAVA